MRADVGLLEPKEEERWPESSWSCGGGGKWGPQTDESRQSHEDPAGAGPLPTPLVTETSRLLVPVPAPAHLIAPWGHAPSWSPAASTAAPSADGNGTARRQAGVTMVATGNQHRPYSGPSLRGGEASGENGIIKP